MGPWDCGQGHRENPGKLGRDSDDNDVQSVGSQGCSKEFSSLWKCPGYKQPKPKLTVSFHVVPVHYCFFSLLQLPVSGQQLCQAWL